MLFFQKWSRFVRIAVDVLHVYHRNLVPCLACCHSSLFRVITCFTVNTYTNN